MKQPREVDLFEQGLALFNAGRFFEAHDRWEILWRIKKNSTERIFCQGLIQAAAAILHAERGNLRGAASTYAKARAKLDPLPGAYMGIALSDLRAALAKFFAQALAGGELPPRPRIRPED
jgi:predicted metal-dependent hydrolase